MLCNTVRLDAPVQRVVEVFPGRAELMQGDAFGFGLEFTGGNPQHCEKAPHFLTFHVVAPCMPKSPESGRLPQRRRHSFRSCVALSCQRGWRGEWPALFCGFKGVLPRRRSHAHCRSCSISTCCVRACRRLAFHLTVGLIYQYQYKVRCGQPSYIVHTSCPNTSVMFFSFTRNNTSWCICVIRV